MATPSKLISSSNKTRRSNKPMMEKKRRERINKSLNILKELVLKFQQKDITKFNKLEKADILEMTVKHVESLQENSSHGSNTNDECRIKYKEGFERCISEVVKYVQSKISNEQTSALADHLKSLAEKLWKENRLSHTVKGETKVKAMTDKSVFTTVLRNENLENVVYPAQVVSPSFTNTSYVKMENQKNEVYIHNHIERNLFPPSPPDSSRSSSSPDSLRESPKTFMDQSVGSNNGLDKMCTSLRFSRSPISTINNAVYILESENKPLNLTVPSTSRQEVSISAHHHPERHSLSVDFIPNMIKREPFSPSAGIFPSSPSLVSPSGSYPNSPSSGFPSGSYPNSPSSISPSGSFPTQHGKIENLNGSQIGNALPLEAGGGLTWRGHSLKQSESRPTPYPKKEAVKRYQNQNPSGKLHHRENSLHLREDLSMPHWRPW